MKKRVYVISDRTGITAETLGNSLLSQFESLQFDQTIFPFIDTKEKALSVVSQINNDANNENSTPIIFATVVNPEIQEIIASVNGMLFDFFNTYIEPLEAEFGVKSSYRVGQSHGMQNKENYNSRIDAVNYALSCDDGIGLHNYDQADLIIIGVSRCGKTPTSLYLALQFGIYVANFPFTEDEFHSDNFPKVLEQYRHKLYGLTISAHRLQSIRHERRPDSRYSSLGQCQYEIKTMEELFVREQINFVNTTTLSIEEISAKILAGTGLKRHFY